MKAVNLIPTEQRSATKTPNAAPAVPVSSGSPIGAYLILAALAFAVVASALYVLTTNSIQEHKAQLAQVEQDAAAVQQQASSLQSFADFRALADSRVSTVKGLAGSRFAWQQALDDVSRSLPPDVYISSMDGSTSAGSGGSSLRGAITAPAIELIGCTRNQSSVARLMSRLRNVRGVTRVTLAKSEATDATSTAAAAAPALEADGSTADTQSVACPKGAPPTFDMIIFFERAAVASAATPNGSTTPISGPTGATGAAPAAGTTGPTGAAGTATPTSSTP